jgi:hypothetical protein
MLEPKFEEQTPVNESPLLPADWAVPAIFRKRLGRSVGRQRAMFADGHLLLVLHAPPDPEQLEREGRFFWRQPDGSWRSNHFGSGTNALTKHLDEYGRLVEDLEQRGDAASSSQEYFDVVYRLDPIGRAARNLHAVLQQARELVPDDADIINFRDRAYQIERTAELLQKETRNGMELVIARRAEEQAVSSFRMSVSAYRLNVLAGFFFPIIALCNIFSTNVKHGLEDYPAPWAWLVILGAGLLLGLILKTVALAEPKQPRA